MPLMDCHTHTLASFDAECSGPQLARAAAAAGLSALCFTDHYDLNTPEEAQYDPPLSRCQATLAQQEMGTRLEIGWGVELGQGHHFPDRAQAALDRWDYDFVIGSVHHVRDKPDFYFLSYSTEQACAALLTQYFDELLELARLGTFDVLGHLTYPLRYMKRAGFFPDLTPFTDRITALFRLLAETGRGIEVNTSGLSPGDLGETLPPLSLLRLYRDCGGELVTVGSDSHIPQNCGSHIAHGQALLRQAGFRYICWYRRRVPRFFPL